MTADFPWGVLLVTDAHSDEQIPEWVSPDELVTRADSALVMRVRHGDEGSVRVRVLSSGGDVNGEAVHRGTVHVTSGVLRISDAVGTASVQIDVPPGLLPLQIFTDRRPEATAVDVVIG